MPWPPELGPWGWRCQHRRHGGARGLSRGARRLELNAATRSLERELHAVSTPSPEVFFLFNDPNAASPLNRRRSPVLLSPSSAPFRKRPCCLRRSKNGSETLSSKIEKKKGLLRRAKLVREKKDEMGLWGRWSGLHGSFVRVRILGRMRKDRDEVKNYLARWWGWAVRGHAWKCTEHGLHIATFSAVRKAS